MALPDFSMRQLLEAGVHFGHQKHRWNPKMERHIFGVRNDIHIIDLSQTVPMLYRALQVISDTVAEGGRVLFVGTKRQAAPVVSESARQCAQYFINSRWLGGTLTNWQTISKSIARLRDLETQEAEGMHGLTKKERLNLSREKDRLERDLGGIKDMGNLPSVLFVIDTNKEAIAIQEARRLNIPVVAVIDTNCDPDVVDYAIPGNDDAARAIELYCSLVSKAALDGIARSSSDMGVDLGASAEAPQETALSEAKENAGAAETPQVGATPEGAAPTAADSPAQEAQSVAVPGGVVADEAPVERQAAAVADEQPATVAEAPAAEAADAPKQLFTAPAGEPDDLKQISGVGPVLESKLHAVGITKFSQIAAFTAEEIEKVDAELNFKGRIERENWLEQARTLAEQA